MSTTSPSSPTSSLLNIVQEWWWRVIAIIVLVIALNAAISFFSATFRRSHCTHSSQSVLVVQQPESPGEDLEEPRPLYLTIDTPLLPLADKDLVVRSAHLNPRGGSSDAGSSNSTLILIETKKSLIEQKAFESCGVGPYSSTKLEVIPIDSESCEPNERFSHTQAVIFCYDLPVTHLHRAWVSYRKTVAEETSSIVARAEQPLILHRRRNGAGVTAVCAAMLPHYTPFVEDWLRYQKTIGVDHVHLTLDAVFLNKGRYDEEFLQVLAEEAFLTVEFWHRWLNDTDICDHSLDLALYDCVLQFQRTYTHVMVADPRDFFIPRNMAGAPLKLISLLSQSCTSTHCVFERRDRIYKNCKKAVSNTGNVTAVLSTSETEGKSDHVPVYQSALLSHSSRNPGLPRLIDSTGVKVFTADEGYFVHLLKNIESSNVRILPQIEKC